MKPLKWYFRRILSKFIISISQFYYQYLREWNLDSSSWTLRSCIIGPRHNSPSHVKHLSPSVITLHTGLDVISATFKRLFHCQDLALAAPTAFHIFTWTIPSCHWEGPFLTLTHFLVYYFVIWLSLSDTALFLVFFSTPSTRMQASWKQGLYLVHCFITSVLKSMLGKYLIYIFWMSKPVIFYFRSKNTYFKRL